MDEPPRSRTAASLDPGAEGRSPDHWYNVLGSNAASAEANGTAYGSQRDPTGMIDATQHNGDATGSCAPDDVDPMGGLFRAIRHVADRNAELADRLAALTETLERHEEERGRLESKVDRLCGLLGAGRSDDWQPLDDAISQRITDGMKPFLLAIIDLLELSMPGAPSSPDAPGAPERETDRETPVRPDEPPAGLPDILIKPLEDLIDTDRNRARPRAPEDTSRRGPHPNATKPAPPQGSRVFSWTPVISEASKR